MRRVGAARRGKRHAGVAGRGGGEQPACVSGHARGARERAEAANKDGRCEVVEPHEAGVLAHDQDAGLSVVAVLTEGRGPGRPGEVVEADAPIEEDLVAGPGHAPIELVILAEVHLRVEAADLLQDGAAVYPALHAGHRATVPLDRVRAAAYAEGRAARDCQSPAERGLALLHRHAAHAADRRRGAVECLDRPAEEVRRRMPVRVDLGHERGRRPLDAQIQRLGKVEPAVGDHRQPRLLLRPAA